MKPITDDQLNLMFNNFAKISQWLSKGKEAKYPLPPLFKTIFSEIEELIINFNLFSAEIETLKKELEAVKNQIKPLDNTSEPETEPETSIQSDLEATADSMPETQSEPLPSSSSFTMEEIETGTIDEDAFTELDKQLNNLLME